MSLLVQAQTSDDDAEIMGCLDLVLRSSKLGLIHESVNVNFPTAYTRTFPFLSSPLASSHFSLAHSIHLSPELTGCTQEAGLPGPTGCLPRRS